MWLIFVTVILALLVLRFVRVLLFWHGRGIPHEPYVRYLYRTFWVQKRRVAFEVHRENIKKYGSVYGTFRFLTPTLAVADVEFTKEVLIKQFQNFFVRPLEFKTGDPLFDKMLPRLPHDEWKAIRAVMGQALTASKMRGTILKTDQVAKRTVQKLRDVTAKGNELVLLKHLQAFSMDAVTAAAFGLDPNCSENPDGPFVKNASNIFQPGLILMLFTVIPRIMQHVPFVHVPPEATMKFFREVTHHILKEKREKLDEAIANNTADVLDLYLIAQKGEERLTDDMIAAQALLFLLAGLEFTAMTLDLATFYFAVYPELQERAFQEVKAVLGERTNVEYQDTQKMKYLEAFILESLRATPTSTTIIERTCTKSTEVAGVKISNGMIIEFVSSDMHLNPEYFPEPERFLPERFLPGEIGDQQNHHAFLLFGDGPKNCVGRRLAIMNIQTLLANLLLEFELEKCSRTPALPLEFRHGERFSQNFVHPFVIRLVRRT